MMTGFLLRFDSLEEHSGLTNEQYGRLIRAALRFAKDGTEPELESPECYLWPGLRLAVVKDQEQYKAKCLQNTENINKRWEQWRQRQEQNQQDHDGDTDEYDRIRTDTKDTNININHNLNDQYQYQSHNQSQSQAAEKLLSAGYTAAEIDRAIKRTAGKIIRNPEAYIRQSIENERRQAKTTKRVPAQDYEQRDYTGVQAEYIAQQDKEMQEYMKREAEEGGQP